MQGKGRKGLREPSVKAPQTKSLSELCHLQLLTLGKLVNVSEICFLIWKIRVSPPAHRAVSGVSEETVNAAKRGSGTQPGCIPWHKLHLLSDEK